MADAFGVTVQDGDGAFEAEARLAGVTGVEIKNVSLPPGVGLVRVAEDDDVRGFPGDVAAERFTVRAGIDDVVEEKFAPGQRDDFRLAVVEAVIVVAEDGGDGGDGFQLENDPRQADVAGVENVIDALEEFRNARVEEVMSVGDDADFHWVGRWCVVRGA